MSAPTFVLNFATGSLGFPLSAAAAQALQTDLQQLVQHLKAAGSSTKQGSPLPETNFFHREDPWRLEAFCNPNIWSSPHAAKVLISLKGNGIRFSTEVELPRLLDDLGEYLAQIA